MAHGEHPVRDHPGEPRRARDLVVLMDRVLVAGGIRVRLQVLPRDDTRGLGETPRRRRRSSNGRSRVAPDEQRRAADDDGLIRRHPGGPSRGPGSRGRPSRGSSSIVARAASDVVHPDRAAPRVLLLAVQHADSSSPSSVSAITFARPAASSGAVTNVGGTRRPGARWPRRSRRTRSRSTGKRDRRVFLALERGFSGTCGASSPLGFSLISALGRLPGRGRHAHSLGRHPRAARGGLPFGRFTGPGHAANVAAVMRRQQRAELRDVGRTVEAPHDSRLRSAVGPSMTVDVRSHPAGR